MGAALRPVRAACTPRAGPRRLNTRNPPEGRAGGRTAERGGVRGWTRGCGPRPSPHPSAGHQVSPTPATFGMQVSGSTGPVSAPRPHRAALPGPPSGPDRQSKGRTPDSDTWPRREFRPQPRTRALLVHPPRQLLSRVFYSEGGAQIEMLPPAGLPARPGDICP